MIFHLLYFMISNTSFKLRLSIANTILSLKRLMILNSKNLMPASAETVILNMPNNASEVQVAKSLIRELKRIYRFKNKVIFIGDKGYDEKDLYNFIVNQMKAQAYIPLNKRNAKEDKRFSEKGIPLCQANLEMALMAWSKKKRERVKNSVARLK